MASSSYPALDEQPLLPNLSHRTMPATSTVPTPLSPRESEVLSMLARGLSNREIAESLYLSPHTIVSHIRNMKNKLNVQNRIQLAVAAVQGGLIQEQVY